MLYTLYAQGENWRDHHELDATPLIPFPKVLDCIGTGMQPYNPIEHIVIIVKENHSFDNYFGSFPGVNGASLPPAQDPPAGGDPPHNHEAWLQRATRAVKLQYSENDIPAYFWFARQFTLCDNYFTEVASQSEPNHLMLIAAASPIIDNANKNRTYRPQEPFKLPTLHKALEKAKLR